MKRPGGKEPLDRARAMRRLPTDAEKTLWQALRGRQLAGAKFRRQVWLGRYIADFYCPEAQLIVEADGGQHDEQRAYDEQRRDWLEQEGFRVLRFWNNEVADNLDGVLTVIAQALTLPPGCAGRAPPSPLQGEGS